MGLCYSRCNSSKSNDCSVTCTCFLSDGNVQSLATTRSSKQIWIWSETHDTTLNECLTANVHGISLDIIRLIKMHSFCCTHHWYITKESPYCAKYYPQIKGLLVKPLCTDWFEIESNTSIRMSLVTKSNTISTKRMYDSFIDCSLPALFGETSLIRRTLHINECPVSITVGDGEHSAYIRQCQVYLIVLDTNESIKSVQDRMQIIDNMNPSDGKCFVLVRTVTGKKRLAIRKPKQTIFDEAQHDELRQMFMNISPSIPTTLSSAQSIRDLFVFAVKYYWFCCAK
eukprot:566663_1